MVYAGVFLSSMSKQKLLKTFPPEHSVLWAHHMTVWHFKDPTEMPHLPWGKSVDLKVVGHFSDARFQAVAVTPPSNLRPQGRFPHISISTVEGVTPAASKDLAPAEVTPSRGLPSLKGVVGWVDARGKVHFEQP